jgi:hypothetical protein
LTAEPKVLKSCFKEVSSEIIGNKLGDQVIGWAKMEKSGGKMTIGSAIWIHQKSYICG